ncbi:hypothetical protein RFI_33445, partial [Reticulomyxa filosa]
MFRTSGGSISLLFKNEKRTSKRLSVSQWPWISEEKMRETQIELNHAKMQLMVEEDRVNELETALNSLVSEKYHGDSVLISKLRGSLDNLRSELALITESKQQLASATAAEMVRLREVVRLLSDQIFELTQEKATIRTFGDKTALEDAWIKQPNTTKRSSKQKRLEKENEEKAVVDNH